MCFTPRGLEKAFVLTKSVMFTNLQMSGQTALLTLSELTSFDDRYVQLQGKTRF